MIHINLTKDQVNQVEYFYFKASLSELRFRLEQMGEKGLSRLRKVELANKLIYLKFGLINVYCIFDKYNDQAHYKVWNMYHKDYTGSCGKCGCEIWSTISCLEKIIESVSEDDLSNLVPVCSTCYLRKKWFGC